MKTFFISLLIFSSVTALSYLFHKISIRMVKKTNPFTPYFENRKSNHWKIAADWFYFIAEVLGVLSAGGWFWFFYCMIVP